MYKIQKAFTLVELVVTITIIAILGTIAFISLQGYSKTSRDSVRISDVSSMKTTLELFHLDAGKFPLPTDGHEVAYSGTEVWTQGTFGSTILTNVGKLNKIPTDPLTDKEYTYSLTTTKQEYQLAGLLESNELVLNLLTNKTNAGDRIASAIVTGNYNGQVLKSDRPAACELLSVPTIISSELDTITDLKDILDNQGLVFNGYNNLPTNQIGGKFKTDEGFDFTSEKLVVYSDTEKCEPLYDISDATARKNLLINLQTAYSGTIIENKGNIRGLVVIDVTDAKALTYASTTFVNNNLGGSVVLDGVEFEDCDAGSIGGITYPSTSYSYGNIEYGVTITGNTSITIGDGTKDYTSDIFCVDGNTSITNEAEIINCDFGFVESGGACIPDECSGSIPSNGVSNETNQVAGNNWVYNTTPGVCTFECEVGYVESGGACILDECTGTIVTNGISNATNETISNAWVYNTTPGVCTFECDSGYEWSGSSCEIAWTSCDDILQNGASIGDGAYTINPDGAGGLAPFDVYCDMTTDGGGWTLVLRGNNKPTELQRETSNSFNITGAASLLGFSGPTFKLSNDIINEIGGIYRVNTEGTHVYTRYHADTCIYNHLAAASGTCATSCATTSLTSCTPGTQQNYSYGLSGGMGVSAGGPAWGFRYYATSGNDAFMTPAGGNTFRVTNISTMEATNSTSSHNIGGTRSGVLHDAQIMVWRK